MNPLGSLSKCLGLALLVVLLMVSSSLYANTSLIQSSARPYGLDIAGAVQEAGSDVQAVSFNKDVLPSLNSWVNNNLSEMQAVENTSNIALDPSKLSLTTDSDVRVYFVSEGAGYHNTLGYSTDGGGISAGDALIFPDASSAVSSYDPSANKERTPDQPLLPGDFVDLGTYEAGTNLNFFVIANGAYGGKSTFSTDISSNPDGINHVVAFALEDSPYLLIGFEDLSGPIN